MKNAPILAINGYLSNSGATDNCHKWLSINGILPSMGTQDIKRILADNLRLLMDSTPSLNTQTKVAQRAEIAQSTVGRLLRAEVYPQLRQVEALAKIFRIDVAALLTERKEARGTGEPDIALQFARLTEAEKRQVLDYMNYLITRHGDQPHDDGHLIAVDTLTKPNPGLAERLAQAIQRELNNDTLNIGHEREQETTHPEKRRRRKAS